MNAAAIKPLTILSDMGGLWTTIAAVCHVLVSFYARSHIVQYVVNSLYLTQKPSKARQVLCRITAEDNLVGIYKDTIMNPSEI